MQGEEGATRPVPELSDPAPHGPGDATPNGSRGPAPDGSLDLAPGGSRGPAPDGSFDPPSPDGSRAASPDGPFDLAHHGDAEVGPGLVDLAVNVRRAPMPAWLREPVAAALDDLTGYPDPEPARAAVAARHGRPGEEVLLTAGAAEGFVLLAQALRGARRPVVVHPQFTEPEAALRAAGHRVERVLLPESTGFRLDPALVPADADLVLLGNPTNPTSVLHPAETIARLARPGRVLVVDEAFADTSSRPGDQERAAAGGPARFAGEPTRGPGPADGEPESLAARRDLPGLVVVRSLTKTWGLAGLRVGYLLGPADLLRRLAAVQPLWAVSTPALAAATACATPTAVAAEREIAVRLAAERAHLVARLRELPGVRVAGAPASAFVLVRIAGAARVRLALRDRGYAVRRGDTFPGLDGDWLRIAVRDTATTDAFVTVLAEILEA
ncbi:Rv2231c family pyridoxal phosphate-dependent protein CobC [Micromonospora sp. NPDC049559]|uniref:Rv2231c family pyridoxal phosphate-dependent protein CobC n=1 Tax=Micromonospora sp. NPDC049559 TaxID=3155923 RepID=UPI003448C43A